MPTVAQTDPTYFNAGVMLPESSITNYSMEIDTYAISTSFLKDLNENLAIQLGLRFDHASKDLKRSKDNSLLADPADISMNEDYFGSVHPFDSVTI